MSELKAGAITYGEVVAIKAFGAFIKLESGETGLVHISQVSAKYTEKVEDVLTVGDRVKVKVLPTENANKISLSIKDADTEATSKPSYQSQGNRSSSAKRGKPPEAANPSNFEGMMKKWLKSSEERLSALTAKQKKNR